MTRLASRSAAFLLSPALVLSIAASAGAESPPSAWSDAEKEHFLEHAEIVRSERLDVGVTGSRRAVLSLDGVTHDAHLQSIDVHKKRMKLGPKTEVNFRDSYEYNIAAYRLDRLLDLRMVPVSVERKVRGEPTAVTWWVDDVELTERQRMRQKVEPPDRARWEAQIDRSLVFSQLVYNTDFNMSNLLITGDWRVWLIDFTRAFRTYRKLPEPEDLRRIDTKLLANLRDLDPEAVRSSLQDCLTMPEIRAVLARRDALVEHFEQRIGELGAESVVYGMD